MHDIETVDLPLEDHMRGFHDPDTLRDWVLENTKEIFGTKLNTIETIKHKLEVANLHFPDKDKRFTKNEQKQALVDRKDLTLALKGNFKLINKETGKVEDEKKDIVVARVPWITDRNTVVYNGTEYLPITQQRLKPGVYTRKKDSGEYEAHINVKPGSGLGGRVVFLPEKALFVYQVGSTQIKLYGVLLALGTSDDQMKQAWGSEIFLKNKQAYDGSEIDKLYDKLFAKRNF